MEEIDMTQALRRYVETGEPPFSLTAGVLISEARRRHRWRVGLGIGAGGAATTLAIFSAIALVPAGGGGPTLSLQGCDVELPLGIWSTATAAPAKHAPTEPPESAGPVPSGHPTPTSGVPEVTPLPGDPSALPEPLRTSGVRPIPGDVDQARLDEMSCFLKRRLMAIRPAAKFAPHAPGEPGGPMEVVLVPGTGADDRPMPAYRAGAYLIDGKLNCLITVTVFRGDQGLSPGVRRGENQATATYKSKSSTIVVSVEGGALTDDQAMAIAVAAELDLYR